MSTSESGWRAWWEKCRRGDEGRAPWRASSAFAALAVAVAAAALACSAKSGVPELPPASTLTPQLGETQAAALSVVYAGPRGEAEPGSTVNVSFDRPLRALDGATPPPPIELEPPVPGHWSWSGTRAVTFAPDARRLPWGTAFRVVVPAGTRALDGTALAAPFELRFETPPPRVVRTWPERDTTGERPDATIALAFDQPVPASALERHAQLRALSGGKATPLPFTVRAHPDIPDRLDILPKRPLPLGASIELSVPAGLRGAEGPRVTPSEQLLRFETYGPLRVVRVRCDAERGQGPCNPEGSVWLELNNPVRTRELVQHLSIEPPVALEWPEEQEDERRYFYLPLADGLAPRTRYQLRVAAGLRDVHGQALAQPRVQTLETADFAPRVALPISGEVFVAPLAELGLVSRNAAGLEVFTRRLDPDALLDLYASRHDVERRRALEQRWARSGARLESPRDNQLRVHPIALGPALAPGSSRGAAWVAWRAANMPLESHVVQVTDLALTAKLSAQGSYVWVTRLSSGEPVAGASVELVGRNPKLAKSYPTDATGVARIPREDYAPRLEDYDSEDDAILIARQGDDASFRRVGDFLRPWRLDVPTRLSLPERQVALLFSDRGIYRPGDTLRVKGIARREATTGHVPLAGTDVTLTLSDPFGEVSEERTLKTTRFGTFAVELGIPASATLGQWRVVGKGFEDDALVVDVAEYRPAEFEVHVEPSGTSFIESESARFRVRGDYLFGSPMSGRALSYAVTRERTQFSPPGAEGYVTDDTVYRRDLPEAPLAVSVLGQTEATLSQRGEHEASVALRLPGQTGPESVRLDASVSDLSRQVISSSAAVLVHPASYYVGIGALDSWFREVPSTLEPRVLAFAPGGGHVPGKSVRLELVRRRWTLAREQTSDGWRTLSSPVEEVQATCSLVTAQAPVSCALPIKESGQFFVRASSVDGRGRSARAALELYAIGAGRPSFADNDQRKLELVLDKPKYRAGDTAKLLVKNPFERAQAWLTVERAGVYEQRRVLLEGPTPTLEIPVDARHRPNVFVGVHLVQALPSTAVASAEDGTPEPGYRLGYAQLVVDADERRLSVELSPERAELRPGAHTRFSFRVTRADGAPASAELTVYAVDEGVLSLTGYTPPDPAALFTAPRPLAVATLESRDALGRLLLPGLERDKGGDGGGGGALGVRSRFETTAVFAPELVTDAEGRASLELDVPDNLTTYRLMAVAVSDDDRYGVGSTTFRVNKPLMLRPALPRALRAGDRFEASVVVNGRGVPPGPMTVELAVTGAALEGPPARSLELGPDAAAEARFTVIAREPGEARLQFSATAGTERDAVSAARRIASPARLETTALYGSTDAAEAQALGDLAALRPDVGGLSLQLASTALVGLDAGLEQLIDYPYACTEQLASGLLPLASLRGLSERYGLALPANTAAAIEARVGEIVSRQRGDGGFGLWPDSPDVHAWTSAYALWVLDQAKRAGARVPARVFDLGVAFLRQRLGEPRTTPEARVTAALALDTLAALEQPDREYTAQLFEQRGELPAFGKALLLHAAVAAQADASLIETLAKELEALLTLRGNQAQLAEPGRPLLDAVFDSEARSEALALRALLAKDPAHPLGEPLARGVLARRDAGHWRSTQESAYALLALDAYRRAREATPPELEAAVWFGEKNLLQATLRGPDAAAKSHFIGMPELRTLGNRLLFQKQGAGTLYYEARLTYAPVELPSTPLERGFSIEKSLRRVELATLPAALAAPFEAGVASELAGGDLVLVDVVIGAPALRHFVVLDDPLPAGLEGVDASLATSSPALDVSAPATEPSDGFLSTWHRRELRDDRVVFFADEMPAGLYRFRYLARATALGRFVVPPTLVSEMYQPEVYARTGASELGVR